MSRAIDETDVVCGTPDGLECLGETARIIGASGRRRYLAKAALEQVLAQISLKRPDVATDSRGRQVQFFRCILDAAKARSGLESAHAIE